MIIALRFAELHAPLFMMGDKGNNLGAKLNAKEKKGLHLAYDTELDKLAVSYDGLFAFVNAANVATFLPTHDHVGEMIETYFPELAPKLKGKVSAKAVKDAQKADTPAGKPIEAQVATPQSHVHAGPGAGQTGQEPVGKKGGK